MPNNLGYLTENDLKILKRLVEEQRRKLGNTTGRPSIDTNEYTSPEVHVAKTPLRGIPALSGDEGDTGTYTGDDYIPGYADCYIYHIIQSGGSYRIVPITRTKKRVFNVSSASIPGETWIVIHQANDGRWLTNPCGVGGGGAAGAACEPIYIEECDIRCEENELNFYKRKVYINIIAGCLTKSIDEWVFERFLGECEDAAIDVQWYCMRPPEGGTGTGTGTLMGTSTSALPLHWYRFENDFLDSGAGTFVHAAGQGDVEFGAPPEPEYTDYTNVALLRFGTPGSGDGWLTYGQLDGSDNFDSLMPNGTVMAFVNIAGGGGVSQIPVIIGDRTGRGWSFGLIRNAFAPTVVFRVGSVPLQYEITPATLTTSLLHVALTWDGATVNIYINGVLASTQAYAGGTITDGGQYYSIGTGGYAYASMDELMLFDYVMDGANIARIAAGGHP